MIECTNSVVKERTGFLQLLAKGGGGGGRGKMRLYGLLGEEAHIHVQSMWQTRGVQGHASPGKF